MARASTTRRREDTVRLGRSSELAEKGGVSAEVEQCRRPPFLRSSAADRRDTAACILQRLIAWRAEADEQSLRLQVGQSLLVREVSAAQDRRAASCVALQL